MIAFCSGIGAYCNWATWVACVLAFFVVDTVTSAQDVRPGWASSRVQPQRSESVRRTLVPVSHQAVSSQPKRQPAEALAPPTQTLVVPDAEKTDAAALVEGLDFASQLPDDESHLIQFVEVLQWTTVVLLIAVVAALAIRKFGRTGTLPARSSVITHLGTLPIKNHFHAHLVEVGNQKFLVTTDRSGVKTVNPVNAWQDFDTPVQEPPDAIAA